MINSSKLLSINARFSRCLHGTLVNLIILRDKIGTDYKYLWSRVYYFTRENKVGLRKIGPDICENIKKTWIQPSKLQGVLAQYYQSMEQQSKSPMEFCP